MTTLIGRAEGGYIFLVSTYRQMESRSYPMKLYIGKSESIQKKFDEDPQKLAKEWLGAPMASHKRLGVTLYYLDLQLLKDIVSDFKDVNRAIQNLALRQRIPLTTDEEHFNNLLFLEHYLSTPETFVSGLESSMLSWVVSDWVSYTKKLKDVDLNFRIIDRYLVFRGHLLRCLLPQFYRKSALLDVYDDWNEHFPSALGKLKTLDILVTSDVLLFNVNKSENPDVNGQSLVRYASFNNSLLNSGISVKVTNNSGDKRFFSALTAETFLNTLGGFTSALLSEAFNLKEVYLESAIGLLLCSSKFLNNLGILAIQIDFKERGMGVTLSLFHRYDGFTLEGSVTNRSLRLREGVVLYDSTQKVSHFYKRSLK